ncbi:hypothetical protein CEXT_155821 [Caerostris extrusa]|uniref:Uncharacterized protein n=1 Tax=Caerostris extrusa TaxID=172846 RepID=A0AAV4Y569_CAEEX|nr:hypothetical protein CEXT_155821 [Caerostris extrusa]
MGMIRAHYHCKIQQKLVVFVSRYMNVVQHENDFATHLPSLCNVTPQSHSGGGLSEDITDEICLCTGLEEVTLVCEQLIRGFCFRYLTLNAP